MKKAEKVEREPVAVIRSPDGKHKEVFGIWKFWEIAGCLTRLHTNRQLAYDVAKWVRHMAIGEKQTLTNGVTIEIMLEDKDGRQEYLSEYQADRKEEED